MHFIFNQALTLHSPDIQNNQPLALIYGPGYTVLSLVASCAAMTIAFFVMGTDLGNWCCVFGGRRKDKENQRQADEYKKWKMEHIKKAEMLSKSSKGMGALVSAASKVAKWSLVEDPKKGDTSPNAGWLSPLSGKGKMIEEEKDWEEGQMAVPKTAEDEVIAKDQKLREIDFRFGRDAARMEIAKRQSTESRPPLLGRKSTERSIRHIASTASLPSVPPAAYPPRRGSIPAHLISPSVDFGASTEVFTPGYNFPPRVDSSTADLLRESAPNSPNDSEASWARRGSMEIPPHVPFDFGRRSSLPTSTSTPNRSAAFPGSLTRIQSLPEADQDHTGQTTPLGKLSPTFSMNKVPTPLLEDGLKRMDSAPDVKFAPEAEEARTDREERAKRWQNNSWTIKIQKFLGMDVVTKEEVFKIVLTGTIAGFGVAAMRESVLTSLGQKLISRLYWPAIHHRDALDPIRPRFCSRIGHHRCWRCCRCALPHVHHAPPQTQARDLLQDLYRHHPRHRRLLHALLR
jgi:hypothetical protein